MIPRLEEIWTHICEEAPREACGLLGRKDTNIVWIPCKNVADSDEEFKIRPEDFMRASVHTDVFAVVHSHIYTSPRPSEFDKINCEATNLEYYIISWPDREVFTMKPLKGRTYEWEKADCFTLVTDYYKQELGLIIPRRPYEKEWWKQGIDYMSTIPQEYGFIPVEGSLKKHDLLLFNVQSDIPNHIGVYTGGDKFIHHAVGRLSCEESLYPFWNKFRTKVLRHESLFIG